MNAPAPAELPSSIAPVSPGPATFLPLRLASALAAVVLGIAASVELLGWGAGLETLIRPLPGDGAMVPATAFGLALLALAQLWQNRRLVRGGSRRTGGGRALWRAGPDLLALGVLGLGALRLSLTVLRHLWHLPIEGDRMAIATSIGLILAAVATLGAHRPGRIAEGLTTAVGALGMLLTLTALGTYLHDREAYARTLLFLGMAPHTALCIGMLFAGAVLSRQNSPLVSVIFAPQSGSRSVRRLLPLVFLGPVLLADLVVHFTEGGGLDRRVWSNGIAAALALVVLGTVLRLGALRNREERLRAEAEARLQAAIDGIDTAVFAFEGGAWPRFVNRSAHKLCGAQAQRWLFEARFHALGDRRPLSDAENPARRLLSGEAGGDLHAGWIDPAGQERTLRFSLGPGRDDRLQVLAVTDETGTWALRERLAQNERLDAIGLMAGGIAHEISNIFGIVQLSTDTALLSHDPAAIARHIRGIQSASARGTDLVRRMLALSNPAPEVAEPIDVAAALATFDGVLRAALPAGVSLVIEHRGLAGPTLNAAPADLQAALYNLVVNARNALVEGPRGGGRIVLTVEAGDRLRLALHDDGPGMAPEVLARARDPFFTTRLERGGSGLGLSMVANFVGRNGGRLEITSPPEGGTAETGTSVVMDFPPAGAPGRYGLGTDLPPEGMRGARLLVMAPEADGGRMIAEFLGALELEAVLATDRTQAEALLDSALDFDLVLYDLDLDGGADPVALSAWIRARDPALPILYLENYGDTRPGPEAGRAQALRGVVLRKPCRGVALLNAIRVSLRPRASGPPAPPADRDHGSAPDR